MKLLNIQQTKYVTVTEIVLTPDEAIELIQKLAAGVQAVNTMSWKDCSSGLFNVTGRKDSKYRQIRFNVSKEE